MGTHRTDEEAIAATKRGGRRAEAAMAAAKRGVVHGRAESLPTMVPHQPDVYLRLMQKLERETQRHSDTRTGWKAEVARRKELQRQVEQLMRSLRQSQESYQALHRSLHEHRLEHAKGMREIDDILMISQLKLVCTTTRVFGIH
jgi:hypothetical protein